MPDPSRYHKVGGGGGRGKGGWSSEGGRQQDSERSWTREVGIQPQ